jgi:hypothetical protein
VSRQTCQGLSVALSSFASLLVFTSQGRLLVGALLAFSCYMLLIPTYSVFFGGD